MNEKKRPFYLRLWFLLIIFFIILFGGSGLYLSFFYPTTPAWNTVSYITYHLRHPHEKMSKETMAFLPYWRLSDIKFARLDLLTEVNYFSLSVDKDGNFVTVVNGKTDPGWLIWNTTGVKDLIAKTQIMGGKFSVTVATTRNKIIESILQNKKAQGNLIANILKQVQDRHLDGVTIDFEYDGKPDNTIINEFSFFSRDLKDALSKTHTSLSLALLPLSAREPGLFHLPALVPFYDRFIGMSYDYYALGSDIAGPVAPMKGFKENKFFFDVETTYEDYLKFIPRNKLIMGIPYYGYDWAVERGSKIQSKTLPSNDPNSYAAVISYARFREDKDLKKDQCFWDDYALSPWCWYTDDKKIDHQVWFEDNRSIAEKYKYAKKSNFAGIAIWTLGYDKQYPDLWQVLDKTFRIEK
ncbi:MAG: glycosyl hydrolase family 18 protein [Candidatus Levyibacteriota bacterium]